MYDFTFSLDQIRLIYRALNVYEESKDARFEDICVSELIRQHLQIMVTEQENERRLNEETKIGAW